MTIENLNITPAQDVADGVNEAGEITIPAGQTVQVLAPNASRIRAQIAAGDQNLFNLKIYNTANAQTFAQRLAPLGVAHDRTKLGLWVYNGSDQDQTVVATEETVTS